MTTLNFFRAVVDAKDKGLQIDIVPAYQADQVIVMVASRANQDGSVDRAYQDEFAAINIKAQTDFIEHAVRGLVEYHTI